MTEICFFLHKLHLELCGYTCVFAIYKCAFLPTQTHQQDQVFSLNIVNRLSKIVFQAKREQQLILMREFLSHLSTWKRRCRKDTLTRKETILLKRKKRLETTGLITLTG